MSSPQGGPLNQPGTERAWGENHAVGNPRRVAENRSRALACMLHVMHVTCCMPLTWGMGDGRVGWGTGIGKVAGPKEAMGHVHDPREWPEEWRWKGISLPLSIKASIKEADSSQIIKAAIAAFMTRETIKHKSYK